MRKQVSFQPDEELVGAVNGRLQPGPCMYCQATDYPLSTDGPEVCPSCACGYGIISRGGRLVYDPNEWRRRVKSGALSFGSGRWDDDQFSDPRFKVDHDGLAGMEDAALREWIMRTLEAESRPGDLVRIVQSRNEVMIAVNGREVGRWP